MKRSEALRIAVRTDTGLVRPHNEDAIFADAALGLAILADGMGGYNAGEVASSMAVTRLAATLVGRLDNGEPAHPLAGERGAVLAHLAAEIADANAQIHCASLVDARCKGMGTTLVVAWFYDNRVAVAHVGDSRLYRLRGGRLERMTRDHSLLQEAIDKGMIHPDDAALAPGRGLITRALGAYPAVDPELGDFEVAPGDLYLLCSDGLTEMVNDEEIRATLKAFGDNPPMAATQLVQMANDSGGRDNISVIVVAVAGEYAVRTGWWRKWLPGQA